MSNPGNVRVEKDLILKEITTPKAVTGYSKLYPKSDKRSYFLDSAGNEHSLSPEIYHVAFVSPTFVDDELLHRFTKIQTAIDWAYGEYGDLAFLEHVVIYVYPGTYEEQIHSYRRYNLIAHMESTTHYEKNVTLYNTGVDAAHWPLRSNSTDVYDMSGFNIVTDAGGTIGYVTGRSEYSKCLFGPGVILEPVLASNIFTKFDLCRFYSDAAFNFTTGAKGARRSIEFYDCYFTASATITILGTHTDTAFLTMYNTTIADAQIIVRGDWGFVAEDIKSYGNSRHIWGGTASLQIINSIISNGIHLETNPSSFKFAGNSCIDYAGLPLAAGQADITADVDITCDSYVNNIQYNGLDGEILIPDVVKNVGGNEINKYKDLVEAVKSVRGDEVLVIYEDLTGLAEIVMPVSGAVTISGQRSYSLEFTGKVVTLGANDILIFNELGGLRGGTVEIAGAAAEFHIHSCICGTNTINILATSGVGSKVHLRNTNVEGDTGNSVIQINNTDTQYLVTFSRIKGATGQPAVEFTVEADDMFHAKFSSFLHGDGGANSPIDRLTGETFTVTTAIYMSAGNASLTPAGIANSITGSGNVNDGSIDF